MVPEFDKKMQEIPVGLNLSKLNLVGISYKWQTNRYDSWISRAYGTSNSRWANTEVDSWLREVRANAYVEILASTRKTYQSKFFSPLLCLSQVFLWIKIQLIKKPT